MRNTTRLAWLAAAAALGCTAWAEPTTVSSCGPVYENLVDRHGAPLPSETPYIAWVERDANSAMVFRQTRGDIAALIARLRSEGTAEGQMLKASFWQGVRCHKVQERCEGTCPEKNGVKQTCVAEPDPRKPPMKRPPMKKPAKKDPKKKGPPPGHGKDDGRPPDSVAQAQTIRCICK